jgi:hypothetical protein
MEKIGNFYKIGDVDQQSLVGLVSDSRTNIAHKSGKCKTVKLLPRT